MNVEQHLCPKCGAPPRYIVGVFHVRLGVRASRHLNGTWEHTLTRTGEQRVGRPHGEKTLALECGGGHRWDTQEIKP